MKIVKYPIVYRTYYGEAWFVDEEEKGEECVIYNIEVEKRYRNKGLGSILLYQTLDCIFEHGYTKAFVVLKNENLRSFYKKLGFENSLTNKNEMYFYKYIKM
jgi:ribosomal protein S18 acetylase RimI-like enzyme